MIPKGLSDILRNRNFLKLWISQVFAMSASNMLIFLLAIRVYQLTNNNFIVSVYIALVSIPPILFSVFAGVFADNHNRKNILSISNLLRVLILVAFIFFNKNPYILMSLAFLVTTLSQFFGPAVNATIPNVVSRKQLYLANSMFMFTTYTAFLVGYSLAGPLLFYLNDRPIFFVLLVMYSIAMVAGFVLPSQKNHLIKPEQVTKYKNSFRKMFHDIVEGLKVIKDNKAILYSILQMTVVFSAERGVIALLPDLANRYFKFNVDEISYYLVLPIGLGAFVGAILINQVKKHFTKRKIINWSLIANGLVLVAIPFYYLVVPYGRFSLKMVVALFAFISGLSDVFIIITAQTLIHETSSDESRGRIFGDLMAFMSIVGVPVILLAGFLASYYNVTIIIGVMGVIVTFFGFLSRFFYKRSLKRANP